ncbi:hypothetical protein Desor_0285 [Desulfosporosinus orientis DSM 765]|uniref:Uncharacterized protein n=1 Tax=Desulfosporosinus orientis (strain ATCC 19365 / DSM 765 / NCIMB 8382 / VKM B-1628 / Singapore I) TaxID=768706 RepID=G7WA05_DESOD|nr:hypothetical protein [Desulfosporosinus orientis]AET66001.1 hypothetical protein Desor_0285 [Desulfosporosinus orientis DSM 765]
MEEKDSLLWKKLFQDDAIPKKVLDNFQTQLMAQIFEQPVDFAAERRLAERRKWGLGLALSLIVSGIMVGILLWFGNDMLSRGLNTLLAGFPNSSKFQQIGQTLLQSLKVLKDIKIGIDLLWGVVSWPLLGIMALIVVVRSPEYKDSIIEKI